MFWDAPANVPLVFPESRSDDVGTVSAMPDDLVIWWARLLSVTLPGFVVTGRARQRCPTFAVGGGLQRLRELTAEALVVLPDDMRRARAERLLATHPRRAADARQLAAALTWSEEQPSSERFVCLDKRLREAARREGFSLLPDEA
jgi:hypothetical protein